MKGLRKSIKQFTHTRADKKLGKAFVDLSGSKVIESLGRKAYTIIVRDDVSPYAWVRFMRHKSKAMKQFELFLAATRADGVRSKVVNV